MYELRILSGLHRGATLPLDENSLLLGASDDADVVLVDSGIEESHATLSLTDSGWLLTSEDGEIRNADTNELQTSIDVDEGDFFRLGTVWLSIVEQEARWDNPPPEPIDEMFDTAEAMAEDSAEEEMFSVAPMSAKVIAETAIAEADAVGTEEAKPVAKPKVALKPKSKTKVKAKKFDKRLLVAGSFAALAVVSAAAYAMSSPSATQQGGAQGELTAEMDIKLPTTSHSKSHTGSSQARKKDDIVRPEDLRSAFRKRLANAELLKRFDLALDDKQWVMRASLDEEEASRFERVLTAFITEHHIAFPVDAKIGTPETMLPFKIRSVTTGNKSSILTQDGSRLYVGDEYMGARLIAIEDNRLTFAGKRKIIVNW